jgi:hypothetical protein
MPTIIGSVPVPFCLRKIGLMFSKPNFKGEGARELTFTIGFTLLGHAIAGSDK